MPGPAAMRFVYPQQRLSGLGVAMLVRPGPNGGTEIVDPSGNVVYSESAVAANPSLLTSLPSPCPGGMLPTWFPGGESVCSDASPGAIVPGEGNSPFAQYNFPINGQCQVAGWCFVGTDLNDPNSYVWQGGGSPTTLNPAEVRNAKPLPSVFTQPDTAATTLSVQDATAQGNPGSVANILNAAAANQPTVVPNPNVSNAIKPPTGALAVSPSAIANGSPQTGNQNMNVGPDANNASGLLQQAESTTGLSGTTLGLIAVGVLAFMMFKK